MLIARYTGEDNGKLKKGHTYFIKKILQCFFREEYEIVEHLGRFDGSDFELVEEDEASEPTTVTWVNRP